MSRNAAIDKAEMDCCPDCQSPALFVYSGHLPGMRRARCETCKARLVFCIERGMWTVFRCPTLACWLSWVVPVGRHRCKYSRANHFYYEETLLRPN